MKITVTATRWSQGWMLTLGPDLHTQVVTLDDAAQQVRDCLDTTDPSVDHSAWNVLIEVPGKA